MLQQILQDMFIDPELLAELSDEQKAMLFVKMREEQVRRWKENEDKFDNEERKKPKKPHKPGKKKVNFLQGKDGNEWVWVMGEHKSDKRIEEILEEEAQAKALKEAEKEMEQLKIQEEITMEKKIKEEKERLETNQREKEKELRRQQEEAELYQSLKEAQLIAQKLEKEKRHQQEVERSRMEKLREKFATEKRKSLERLEKKYNRRSCDIYAQLKEKRVKMEKMAEENSKEIESNWKEQEKKAKQAEIQLRDVARQARIEYRNSLQHTMNVMNAVSVFSKGTKKEKPPIPPKNAAKIREKVSKKKRPQRPTDRASVVQWFLEEERPRHSGVDVKTGKVHIWFHGIISRSDAEYILINFELGSFLVRVSERVWGYTISYRAEDRCKHFLIDTSEDGYQFFGANQVQHQSLEDLIKFHHLNSITIAGGERLLHPVGQQQEVPDYDNLMSPRVNESTAL